MPSPTKGPRLGGSPTHERMILGNLASQLFEHGRIVTTEAKAKRLRPLAEKLITKAKRGDLHARRQVMQVVKENDTKSIVHTLFTEIAPGFADRDGGYVRITKVGPRKGDNAPMAVIELVTESVEEGRSARANAAKKSAAKKAPAKKAPAKKSAAPAPTASSEPDDAIDEPNDDATDETVEPNAEPTDEPTDEATATATDEPSGDEVEADESDTSGRQS